MNIEFHNSSTLKIIKSFNTYKNFLKPNLILLCLIKNDILQIFWKKKSFRIKEKSFLDDFGIFWKSKKTN